MENNMKDKGVFLIIKYVKAQLIHVTFKSILKTYYNRTEEAVSAILYLAIFVYFERKATKK